ncbi:hypothetical protein SEA_PARIES_79 [Gordonia phage Paries]|uniref:Uncharacterized protein n=1 Tax=Gordonia phage Paries TaxID=2762413 RepID=A0A7G8LE10_9CAUD|nr:hypothetical protein KNV17_gp79 [Gordonia phage Paries]QNJ55482.1 hypothetical protein SEA_PARIES_79 [Gordonia phage Paries]
MPMKMYTIPLREPSATSSRSHHDRDANISVEHNPMVNELTVWPLGCATPMRNYDDFDRFVDALVEARRRIQLDREENARRIGVQLGTTMTECKQGCGTQVRVPAGFERHAECARCAGLESEVHGG